MPRVTRKSYAPIVFVFEKFLIHFEFDSEISQFFKIYYQFRHMSSQIRNQRQVPVAKPRIQHMESISITDFSCQAVLGRGHFGKVIFERYLRNLSKFSGPTGEAQSFTSNVCNKSTQKSRYYRSR